MKGFHKRFLKGFLQSFFGVLGIYKAFSAVLFIGSVTVKKS